MYWIGFTARSNGPLIFWDRQAWGTINAASFIEHILPPLRDWLRQEEEITGIRHSVLQDNARPHTANRTRTQMAQWDMPSINHPPSSPDVNPAENPIGQIRANIRQ
ncbi:hypothetical protein GJ744_005226 [Endocarpon pusillum]|uniref:Tc1-like transposase DDE domain-containing protein n=1 Tax=Endocarpon pusillum TaxID=364733 RepID=A0A8H7A5W1_9EURO|nr:hypothetical protein GJ744_005226 [Endocarpon pusillum]